jgi:hypothetical protein
MLRCLSRVALLGTLLAIGLGFQPMAAHAAANASTATADYTLTTSSTIGVPSANISGPQIVALITPTGGVVPPTNSNGQQVSPLTVLPNSTGFDPNQLVVALKEATSAQPEQDLGLIFFGKGFQAGGVLHFALSINSALASDPPVLTSLTPGITITPDSPSAASTTAGTSASTGSSSGSSSNGIPEPLSVILWSAVLVGVVARNRMLSRRQAD